MKRISLLVASMLCGLIAQAQYCTTSAPSSTADEEILRVQLLSTPLDNITNCANSLIGSQCNGTGQLNKYTDFTTCSPASVFLGTTYTMNVTIGTCGTFNYNSGVKVYIDYNHNNLFTDPGEEVYFTGVGVNITCVPQTIVQAVFTIPLTALPGSTRMRIIDWEGGQSTATTIMPCAGYGYGETEDYNIFIIPPTPCSGKPNAGCLMNTTNCNDTSLAICPTKTVNLCSYGSTAQSNLMYTWQKSTNGGTTWSNITGANQICYTVPANTPSACYRMISMCMNSFQMDTTNKVCVTLDTANYAPLPYTQSFENWMGFCDTKDVPDDKFWVNNPSNGNASWRRNDEGSTAGWATPTNGSYLPVSSLGNYSARFHGYAAGSTGTTTSYGFLDLRINLSAFAGTKDLFFDYKNVTSFDTLAVLLSTNGGGTFTQIGSYDSVSNWLTKQITINSNSANAVIRFQGKGDQFGIDLGLDNINVVPPCAGMPNAGTIPDTAVCQGDTLTLHSNGASLASGLTYTWQSAPTAAGPWTTLGTSTINKFPTVVNAATFYRVTILCTASGLSATSNAQSTTLAPFYFCYCSSYPTATWDAEDIGCVQLLKPKTVGYDTLIFNVPMGATDTFMNTSAIKAYTSYQFLPVKQIFRDSLYHMELTGMYQFNSTFPTFDPMKVWIDYNRDNLFDATEVVGSGFMNAQNHTSFDFVVPSNAQVGITGLRVILSNVATAGAINPCGAYSQGETEDYLVEIMIPPCKAPTNPGVAHSTESLMCPGYTTILFDTNHTKLNSYTGLSMNWQVSTNGATYTDIPGATTDSATVVVNAASWYRLKIICTGKDTVYSNFVKVNMEPSYACYPASAAIGGTADSSDNGYFTIANYNFSSGGATGPHVGNPAAIRSRTNFSSIQTIQLYSDSTYKGGFYNILKPYFHGDAQITMFVDYNNNGIFDIPAERVFSGISGASSFYLPYQFKTAMNPAFNINTGMRIVLNNNTAPNAASDLGVGLYTSGETEDFTVMFKKKPVAGVGINDVFGAQQVSVYPNPSNGIVFVDAEAYGVKDLKITVTTITGSEVYNQVHSNINGAFNTTVDLSAVAKGTYLVKFATEKGSFVQKVTIE